jgi:hypothetical protein
MAIKVFTAEGVPTNGTQLTTSNEGAASGDVIAPIKGVSASVTGTANGAEVINGNASVKLVDSNSYAFLSWPESNLTAAGLRAYFRLSSTATSYSIMGINGSATMAKVVLLSNGHFYVQDTSGTVTYQTPSAVTFPGIYAVDLAAQPGTTTSNGQIQFAVYDTNGDLTAGMNAPFTSSSANTGTAPITSLNVGKIESSSVSMSMIVDDIQRTDTFTLVGPVVSQSYTAVISPDSQTGLTAGDLRTLSAANSTGNPSVYQWTQTAGPPVTLANTNSVTTSYPAPAVTLDSSVTIQLKVGDLSSLSPPDTVTDTVLQHQVWFMKNGTLTAGTFRKQTLPDTVVTATNITSNSVTLNWTGVTGATSYLTGRDGTDSNGNGPYQTTDSGTTRSRTFINLLPSTTYTIYCTPQPNGNQQSLTITTAAAPGTVAWDWSDTNLPWAYSNPSVFTSGWPSGVTIVDLQTGSGSFYTRLNATINAAGGARVVVRLPAGVHHLTSFNMIGSSGSPTYAFGFWHAKLQGFLGQGADQTFIQMDANSVTQAQLNDMMTMDAGPTGSPNQMGFMRLDGTSASPILISGVTFRAEDQPPMTDGTASVKSYGAVFPDPAPFNGLVFYSNSSGIISYSRFQAAGHAKLGLPPFEHANVNSQYSPSMVYSHCEMDGRLSPDLDPTQPRRCGPVMANNETLHTMSDCWLHHSLWTRYAANDQNRDTYGTYNLTRTKIEQINPSSAGWESCAAAINITDCIIDTDSPVPSGASGNTFHLSLTPVGSRSNPQGGRLTVTRGTFNSSKYPSVDGYLTIRAIASMHWVTDGYNTTMMIYNSSGQRKSPYVVSSWPASSGTLSAAGVTPNTHYLVVTS